MLALSSVLCCNIESAYPDQNSLVWKILNGTVKPRYSELKNKGYTSNFVDQFQKCCGDVQTKPFYAVNKFMQVEPTKAQSNQIGRHCSRIPKYRKTNKVRWFWYIEIFIRLFNFIHSLTLPPSYVVPTHVTYFPCTF